MAAGTAGGLTLDGGARDRAAHGPAALRRHRRRERGGTVPRFDRLGFRSRPPRPSLPLPRAPFVCRPHGLEHRNYARMLDDHEAGLRSKSALRRVWYPASRLSQVAAAARVADALILINDGDRAFATDRGWQPPEHVAVVPHGISERFISAAPPDAPRGAGLLFCGTWDLMKGVTYVAE